MTHPSLPRPRPAEVRLPRLSLQGMMLEDVVLRGSAYGVPVGDGPVVVTVGGITASSQPFGDGEQRGWWPALLDKGLVDPTTQTLLTPDWPAQGSGWSGLGESLEGLPGLSVLDLADLIAAWLEGLGVDRPVHYIGASLGGLVGLALAARHPAVVSRLVSISAGLRPDGWGTATRHLQRELVRDGLRAGDVRTGMIRARQLGMVTYRGREELDRRFPPLTPEADRPPVAAYLDHHGATFADAFSPAAFMLLSEAIDRCHLAATPGGIRRALEQVQAEVAVVGVPQDLLFPWTLQQELHRELRAAGARTSLWKLDSDYGHDAFLADQDRLASLLLDTGLLKERAKDAAPRFVGHGSSPHRHIRLGLVGCGVVGQGLLELLARQRSALTERYGVKFDVTRIAVRDVDRDRGPHADHIPKTTDALALVAAPDVDVVVEVAGGIEDMNPVISAALAAGKPVVSANKALLADRLADLAILAHRTGTPLACEASCAAALPILRALAHQTDDVRAVLGIVNGTCNFLITRLEQDETPLAVSIPVAQSMGLAEADPSADLEGRDAAAKLSLLAYRAFGAWAHPREFHVRGIRELTPADPKVAAALGWKIRHIAHATITDEGLDLAVEPLALPSWHLLANVEEEYNAVYLSCRSTGDLSFFGKGAGSAPTASALLGDLIDLAQDHAARWPAPRAMDIVPWGAQPRAHLLRVSTTAAGAIGARVAQVLRDGGVEVERTATVDHDGLHHLGLALAPCTSRRVRRLVPAIRTLPGVVSVLDLGVLDQKEAS